jgi:hypothetical protein
MYNVKYMHCMTENYISVGLLQDHKVLLYTVYVEHHSVCPPRRNWEFGTPPTPLRQASVPSPGPKVGARGARSPAAKGEGESQFRRLEKKLSTLPTLCSGCLSKEKEERNKCRRDCKTEILFSADWPNILQKYANSSVSLSTSATV